MAIPPLSKPLLLIEDTLSLQIMYRAAIETAGHSVITASSAAEARRAFAAASPEIVLLDLTLPDGDGIVLLHEMLAARPQTSVIVITANASISKAVEAMRAGAQDFLVKPLDEVRLLNAIRNAAATIPAASRTKQSKSQPGLSDSIAGGDGLFIGSSPEMRQVHSKIRSVAPSMATVFITGESGTGKELCALSVHAESPRANGPFIALNCGAIPQDLLESEVFGHIKGSFTGAISDKPGAAAAADGGTLFLDEVCEMAPPLQTKLLRFLQTSTVQPVGATRPKKVNVRIVCATNRDPLEAVRRGEFREDLFYRLFVVPIHMPALRDRGEDVIEIANSALARFGQEEGRDFSGLSPEVIDLFRSYSWPGNVRQVLNVIRNIVVLNAGGIVSPGMLPDMLRDMHASHAPVPSPIATPAAPDLTSLLGKSMAEIERLVIAETIALHGGSVSKAARVLDLSPSTIYRKLESWGIKP
ncbi:sigma-54-dependent transcriptional regulator [Thioclava sp. FR2]|uniref:sigma-54-dependent transcriptional regulator n=1 Tax=Thioclava sp. FR2 TaxID=3445780 RepID=UPI003EB7250F